MTRSPETKMKLLPELELEILSRLPVKSLLRFRCVSKQWLRLLTTDTNFINNMHLPRSLTSNSTNPNPSLISISDSNVGARSTCYLSDYTVTEEEEEEGKPLKGVVKPLYIEFPVSENMDTYIYQYKCVGICNGLVCLALYKYVIDTNTISNLFVWNPLTRDHISLSCSSRPSFLQPRSESFFGFGFHQPSNQYKVVRILTSSNRSPHISVYTLGSKTWRNLGEVDYKFGFYTYPITINGIPHWSVHKKKSESESRSWYRLVVYFDVEDEVLKELPLPFTPNSLRIVEFCGMLCIVVNSILEDDIEMWVMKEHGVASSWTKLFKVGKLEIPDRTSLWIWCPIGISGDGEITLRRYYEQQEMKLLIYNPKTNSFKGPINFGLSLDYVSVFAGSLVSPKVINGGDQEVTLIEEI